MEWDLSCNVGFASIDHKREELFNLIRPLIRNNGGGLDARVFQALKATAQYASQQFPVEEELMRGDGYPGLAEHQEQHNQLRKQVISYLSSVKEGESSRIGEIVRFLLRLLDQHILGSDLKFSDYRESSFQKNKENELEQQIIAVKQRPIEKILKLKNLFKEKLITIDDFKDRKVKIFAEYLKERGLENLRMSFNDLEEFQKNDHLNEKERKLVIIEFLARLDLCNSLESLNGIEEKLVLLNTFFECEMVDEEAFQNHKDKILSQI